MEEDRIKWNRKYRDRKEPGPAAEILRTSLGSPVPGRALDLACGPGHNSIFLADQGWQVDAIDISDVALKLIDHPRVSAKCQDLDDYTVPNATYDLIVNLRFLDRRLFPSILDGLRPEGVLVFETFLQESAHVSRKEWKLEPGELSRVFSDLTVLLSRETDGLASFIARKPG